MKKKSYDFCKFTVLVSQGAVLSSVKANTTDERLLLKIVKLVTWQLNRKSSKNM